MDSSRPTAVESAPPAVEAAEVSVVIPCLNEASTIGICIQKAQRSLAALGVAAEIVVADNGSDDGSQEVARRLGARVVPVRARGYGSALAGGFAAARGTYVIMGDADDSYDFSELAPFVDELRAGNDLVVGNRFRGGIEPGAMPFMHKYMGNPLLTFIAKRVYGSACGDIYCGLRGFHRERVRALDLRATGMELAIEMVVKATMAGLRVTEVPTVLSPDGRGRPPHLRTWRDGWRSLRFLLLYSPSWLFLYPGLALIALGLAGMVWLLPEQRTIGSVTFDVSTLLFAAFALIVGLQTVIFFVGAKLFAVTEGLLPEDARFARFVRSLRLERGLVIGALMVVAGVAVSLRAVATWQATSFGRLDYPEVLRWVIPGGTLITCGVQIAVSSLFLAVLGLRRR
jgi:hypothetical protein